MTNDFGFREKLPYQVVKLCIATNTKTMMRFGYVTRVKLAL
jgi:hypothetical protein